MVIDRSVCGLPLRRRRRMYPLPRDFQLAVSHVTKTNWELELSATINPLDLLIATIVE
ncbi:hypothetical protein J6590_026647 [Homalodisca vitripennis]|nr:hypothetical protein J6590_026647 [Homalodisca vitripennis]